MQSAKLGDRRCRHGSMAWLRGPRQLSHFTRLTEVLNHPLPHNMLSSMQPSRPKASPLRILTQRQS